MFTIITYAVFFLLGAITGIIFSAKNPKMRNWIYQAAKKAEEQAEALLKRAKKK